MAKQELWLDDVIGSDFWDEGITQRGVRDLLSDFDLKQPLTLRINSPGGDVFEASGIESLLQEYPGTITAQIDGLAASAASWLAMAGDEIIMTNGSMMMIHDPWTWKAGNAEDLRKEAEILDKLGGELASAYGRRLENGAEQARDLMLQETWLTPGEAIDLGLADMINGDLQAQALVVPEAFRFRHVPKKVAIAKVKVHPPVSANGAALEWRARSMASRLALTKARAQA